MLDFKLPSVGENVKGGTIVNIFVKVGDAVKKGQDILELETEKASLPVPSPVDGVVKEILVKANQEVKIGQLVMKIEEGAGAATAAKAAPSTPKSEAKTEAPKPATKTETKSAPVASASVSVMSSPSKDVAAAPSVRRFAREIGIDIGLVPGTGPSGRISLDDVKEFSKALNSGRASGGVSAGMAQRSLPDFTKFGAVERKPMNNIRKATANHMAYCWSTIPHVTQFDKADITELEKLRKRVSTDKRKLTITPFLLKVMASALKTFPQFNSSIDMATNEIIEKKYYNVGVAVDTERGLLVPVIKDIDKKSIFHIADELTEMAERARNKKTTLEEMQGGSMTLTNLGGIGGTYFTPIVNWPEVSILGISRGGYEPQYENGQFIPRFKLPLSLSYDHRLIDGADGARFLRWIAEAIEQPFMMELEK
jgi:pyruvate dehydrogenase E2 component (dihydrolipoamide acetyltransferase)